MKNRFKGSRRTLMWFTSMALACMIALCGMNTGMMISGYASAEAGVTITVAEPAVDPSPAIYVAQKNVNSVVGVITNTQSWDRRSGEVVEEAISQGSGVVIAEGGYILTNYHVIEGGDSFRVLLSNGEKVEATLVGSDSPLDLAVLQVVSEYADMLTPVSVGASGDLIVGSTVIAIGNPGGEALANTVTQGIVSALERSQIYSSNTSRHVDYIQHDAAINSGNSGGGLFNYKGELVGINTLKYSGSAYSGISFEGLGFAIPVDTAYPIAMQLIENGEVVRPQMGISVLDVEGPDEPMGNYPPSSVCIYEVSEDSPAARAGLQQYDFIYAINGERVYNFRELTAVLDNFQAGDSVSVTVVRYHKAYVGNNSYGYGFPSDIFGGFYGYYPGYSQNSGGELVVGGGYQYVTVDVTLELPEK